jgi:hypothetical protein
MHNTDQEPVEEAVRRRRPHVGMATTGRWCWVPIVTPALASMQLGHRHGKSSIPSGRLLHAMMVLSGGDVAEALLNHIQQAARHRQVRGSCACSMDPAMILRMP